MTYAGVAQRERQGEKPTQEVAGSTPVPRSNPWAITEAEAAARDDAIACEIALIAQRCIVPGMPEDHVLYVLARRGITAAMWRRVRPRLEALIHG